MSDLVSRHALCSCQLGMCSPYICECRPRRSLIAAIRDISAVRDLPMSYFELILPRGNVVSLSAERRKRHA